MNEHPLRSQSGELCTTMYPVKPKVSVVLCTFNPRRDLLIWALKSIERQSLPKQDFEFVIVDNNSNPPLDAADFAEGIPVSFRLIRQPKAGLCHARVAGIAATSAPLLVFLDDDNYLDADYLEQALSIAADHPYIGCFGGKSRAVFEGRVASWKHRLLAYLGVRDYGSQAITSNQRCWGEWEPIGAGMVCRRDVADRFAQWIDALPSASRLGRRELGLMSGEDTLVAQAAYSLSYSCSYQPALKLSHWMKAPRLRSVVLARTLAGHGRSYVVLQNLKGEPVPRPPLWSIPGTLTRRYFARVYKAGFGVGTIEWFWDIGYFREVLRTGQ